MSDKEKDTSVSCEACGAIVYNGIVYRIVKGDSKEDHKYLCYDCHKGAEIVSIINRWAK